MNSFFSLPILLFSAELFSFHEILSFMLFLLLLTSSFSLLLSDRIQAILSVFFYLLLWSIFEKVSWGAEEKVYSFVLGRDVLSISVRLILFTTSVSSSIFPLTFCLKDLSICKSGVLNCTTLSVWRSKCDLSCTSISFKTLDTLVFGGIHVENWKSSLWIFPFIIM